MTFRLRLLASGTVDIGGRAGMFAVMRPSPASCGQLERASRPVKVPAGGCPSRLSQSIPLCCVEAPSLVP